MKHAALIIHLTAVSVLFVTLGQPASEPKPAGVRRAVETIAKSSKCIVPICNRGDAITVYRL